MHEWCDLQWCKYLQANLLGQEFTQHSNVVISRACLDLIKPMSGELYSKASLVRVVGGGSQNTNETSYELLWTMMIKHRFCSSIILRIDLRLLTVVYNGGYESLKKLFESLFAFVGHYADQCFSRIDGAKSF